MKKLIITAAIALTATFSFFTYQSKAVSNSAPVVTEKITNSPADISAAKTTKADIGQADIN